MMFLKTLSKKDDSSIQNILINLLDSITKIYISNKFYQEFKAYLPLIERITSQSQNLSQDTFVKIINFLAERAKEITSKKAKEKEREESLEQLLRAFSGIAERLINNMENPNTVIITTNKETDKFNELFYTLIDLGEIYIRHPNKYPLVYFDVISTVSSKFLAFYVNKNKSKEYDEVFSTISYTYRKIGEKNISVSNNWGAGLATMKLIEYIDEMKNMELEKKLEPVLQDLIALMFYAYVNKKKLKSVEFLSTSVEQYIFDYLIKNDFDIAGLVKEQHIRDHKLDHNKRWELILKLGKAMNSNFGFNFNPKTGEIYPR
jgi:hypothetical protein